MKALSFAAVLAMAGLGGAVALAVWFPRLDPSAASPLELERGQAIERVRQLASRYGADTSGWSAVVTDQTDQKLKAYLALHPDDSAAKTFGLLHVNVTLIAPARKQIIRVALFGDGRPAQWKWTHPPAEVPSSPAPEAVLADFAGSRPGKFVPGGESEDGGSLYDCVWTEPDRAGLHASLKMERKAGVVRSVTLSPTYPDAFEEQYKRRPVLTRVAGWVGVAVWAAALIACFVQTVRGRMRWRISLVLLGVQVIWAAVSFWGGTYYQEFVGRTQSIPDQFFFMVGENFAVFWSFFWLPVLAGAGSAMRSQGNAEKWFSMAEIASGRISGRAVAGSLETGILSGVALAAIPYLVAVLRLPGSNLASRGVDALVAPLPAIVAVRFSAAIPALALFGFLYPWLRYLRKPAWFWLVFVPAGVLVLMDSTPFQAPAPSLAAAALLLAGYLLIYLRCDLLAVLAAAVAARAAVVPCLLLAQPLSSARASAIWPLAVGVAVMAASVYWALRGPETPAARAFGPGFLPEADAPARSDRERLQAEFEIARKAQQDALPGCPPPLAGYSVAGWCEPAQQVGGDLYDFFPLPDGRLGIAVADVSGKGVPAALYMMLTKGLLAAVSRESDQLLYILVQINLHLYRACRKKVFVTMAAVVLDAARRRLEYGRAGHNPVVWRRTRKGETRLVKPPGLGLGMTPGERFTATLRIEELELEPEDALVLYSDGVTEAVNHAMEQFGEARLMRAVENTDGRSALESRDAILQDLSAFMGAAPARDDITLVVVRVGAE
ncbi:MAG TPA: PP2C family protein-serine/threonine phosphatase [Bryobacteraceae bacterium]|nr:PP2C family protein-serine/threonine phosphatase [Bryobacteraceae bacterium]